VNLGSLFGGGGSDAQEARHYAGVMRTKLTQLGVCYRYKKNESDFTQSRVMEVRFNRAVVTDDAIYYQIDTLRLPRGISLADIAAPEIINDLSVSCRRPVRFISRTQSGAWLVVARGTGVFGIKRLLPFADISEAWPTTTKKTLLVPLGVGENRRLVYRSLASMPHALVGGATGGGKTTLLHAWLCSLLLHNAPERLQVAFIDLKGGAEAAFYRSVPHLLEGGIVTTGEDVGPLLQRFWKCVDDRLQRFGRAEVQNITAWNYRHRSERFPRWVLVVDEMANIMLDKAIKKTAQSLLADITARGRAAGVHVVLATQRPEVAVIPGLIKANLDARVGFRCTDNASSMVILDDTSAARFGEDAPPGRFVYKRGLERATLQAPMITAGQIREVVKSVKAGGNGAQDAARISPEELFDVALTQLGGDFSIRALYKLLDGKAGLKYIQRIASEYEDQIVEIQGNPYILKPSVGNKPRRFMPVEG